MYRDVHEILIEHRFELGEFNELEIKLLCGKAYEENKRANRNKVKKTIKDFIEY